MTGLRKGEGEVGGIGGIGGYVWEGEERRFAWLIEQVASVKMVAELGRNGVREVQLNIMLSIHWKQVNVK